MKTSVKRFFILVIAAAILVLGIVAIINFGNYNSAKKIEKLKTSTITYLGKDSDDNFVYIGNDAKVYKFSGYSNMQDFAYETVNARKDGLEGVISKDNKVIVPFGKYYDILDTRVCGTYIVKNKDEKYGLLSYDGKQILETIYDNITSYGDDVPVFKAKYGDNYYIETIYGTLLYDTTNEAVNVVFEKKLDVNSDSGLVKIDDSGVEKVFNISNGRPIISGKNISIEYDTVKDTENNRYLLIDKSGLEKQKVDYIAGEESLDLKFDKYVIIETKANYYEIYDKSFNKIFETERKPVFFKNYKNDIYIVNNTTDGVDIYKDNKVYSSIKGYEYALESMTEFGCIVPLKNLETSKTNLYNFELELLKEDVLLDKIYPKYVTLVDSESQKIAFTYSKEEIKLGNDVDLHALNTNSTFNDYILVSKSDNIYDMLDLKGNYVIRNIAKIDVLLDNHIIITDNAKGDMYLFSIDANKEIFRFAKDKFDSYNEKVQAIKLKTGFYNYKGEQIAMLDE